MAKRTKDSVFTALVKAVAAKYQEEGDLTKAGIVVACLSYEPPRFYASVARYPNGPMGPKKIVTRTKRSDGYVTAEEAVEALAEEWFSEVKPPPVKDTLADLSRALTGRK